MRAPIDITLEPRRLDALAGRIIAAGVLLGAVFLLCSWLLSQYAIPAEARALFSEKAFYLSYLVGVCFVLSLSLGGLFFVLIQHVTGAGWSVVVRRLAEGLAMAMPFVLLFLFPVLFWWKGVIYEGWMDPAQNAHLGEQKLGYLNAEWFSARVIGCIAIWTAIAAIYFGGSLRQDASGDPRISKRLKFIAGPCIIVFALTLTLAAFDLLMSLVPEWYSTIFGVYYFAGSAMVFFAFLANAMRWLQRNGRLSHSITPEHYHDVGKFCFAFVVFWAYIAFSQYMLMWYANLPEETSYYRIFHKGEFQTQWGILGWILIIGHFFVPFLLLLSRHVKRNPAALVAGTVWVMLMHYVDLFWLVFPHERSAPAAWVYESAGGVMTSIGLFPLLLTGFCATAGLVGFYVAAVAIVLRGCSLVPERDPRLPESLVFENA